MRRRHSITITAALALALGLTFAVTGCSQPGDSNNDSSQSETKKPDDKSNDGGTPQKSEPAPTANVLAFPGCGVMNPVAKAESDTNTAGIALEPPQGPANTTRFLELAGPAAIEAISDATRVEGCYYPVSMHNAVFQWVIDIPKEKYQSLVETLRSDSFYTSSTVSGITVFSYTITEETMLGTMKTHYAYGFIGDVWIAIIHNAAGDYTASGVDSVLAANPWLLTASG